MHLVVRWELSPRCTQRDDCAGFLIGLCQLTFSMFMELPVSGLHRLFHTNPSSSTSARDQVPLESVTEEVHTRDLLYPALEALLQTQQHAPLPQVDPASLSTITNTFDEWIDLSIESGDIRVLVAQDGNAINQQSRVLYDSQPTRPDSRPASPRDPSSYGLESSKTHKHGPKAPPRSADVDLARRDHDTHSGNLPRIPHTLGGIPPQSLPTYERSKTHTGLRPRKDHMQPILDNVETLHAIMARESREETNAFLECMFGFTGLPLVSSTKIHVDPCTSTSLAWKAGGIPRSSDSNSHRLSATKRILLNQSMTSEGLQRLSGSQVSTGILSSTTDTIAPTMLITRIFSVEKPSSVSVESPGFAARDDHIRDTALQQQQDEKVKPVKIPRFAVSLVLHVPRSRKGLQTSSSMRKTSINGSFEDSHLSAIRPADDLDATEYDIERITAHWNVLTRVLSSLETAARKEIQVLLTKTDQPDPLQLTATFVTNLLRSPARPQQKEPKQPSQRVIHLLDHALQHSNDVATVSRMASLRISHALDIRRAATGQGRWGVWREEARWVGQWANGREQNFFLFNLLTAFLGNHTDWLNYLRHEIGVQKRAQHGSEEAHPIRRRTVVVSADRMAARRLIFLLSMFLPGTSLMSHHGGPDRPFLSRSSSGLSQSPPFGVPLSRELSLRRKINRRPKGQKTDRPLHMHERSISFSTPDLPTDDDQQDSLPRHARRSSDAYSIKSLALPIPLGYNSTRKSSITTDSTPVPRSDIPVAHFSGFSYDKPGTAAVPRPGSSGSLASLSLRRTLSRSDSSGAVFSPDSPTTSRWGSMLSSFWSARRGSSTEGTDGMASPNDGFGISGIPHSTSPRSPSKLARMAEEASHSPSIADTSDQDTSQGLPSPGTITEATPAKDIPERPKPEEFPLNLSIDTNDGVVDIDLPATRSCPSSYTSSVDSQQVANTASSSFNDHSSLYGRASTHTSSLCENSASIDVAGYIRRYHQDFALQAVRPYKSLREEIKQAMRDESTPSALKAHEWIDVCTTLIADTTDFSVTRLSLRRKHGSNSTEEQFTEEPVMDFDPTLTDAVERILAPNGQSSNDRSPASSPSRPSSKPRHAPGTSSPVPRSECKSIIVGALEEVARSVAAEYAQEGKGKHISTAHDRASLVDSTLREGVRKSLSERTAG